MKSFLLEPIQINSLQLKNRIIMPSMLTNYAAINGEVTDRLIHYYEERARGGAALIMIEATYVERQGDSYPLGLGVDDDDKIPGLRRLTEAIHKAGGKAGLQLQHGGRTANPHTNGGPVHLVSYIPGLTPHEGSRVLDKEEIGQLVKAHARATLRAMKAGFDLVELHGAHGYLINQFLSPATNRRTDEYGGSPENCLRFALEVLKACREAVGPAYPITMRLSVEEYRPGGLTLEDSIPIAQALVENGIDALNISVAGAETNRYTIAPSCFKEGFNADLSARIKQAVKGRVPVAVVGRIVSPETGKAILTEGKADLIAMGRALIADPYLPSKVKEGREALIAPCIACNEGCAGNISKGASLQCAVNPRAGLETRYPVEKAAASRRVLVVGAGPAGMQAALTAAQRGHSVTLMERETALGGLLNIASLPPHKQSFLPLLRYFTCALSEVGVDIRLGKEVSVDTVRDMSPDMTIVATGSLPLIPRFCRGTGALTAQQILLGAETGNNVLILGGGLVGSETAEFLAVQGKKVTILELRDAVAADMEGRTRQFLIPRLEKLGVHFLVNTEVVTIEDGPTVYVRDARKREYPLKGFDTIVMSLGYRGCDQLFLDLQDAGLPCIHIGDSVRAGKILTAVRQGFDAAYAL